MSRHREKLFFYWIPLTLKGIHERYIFSNPLLKTRVCVHTKKKRRIWENMLIVCVHVCVCQDTKREMYYFIEPQSPSKVHERIIFLNPLLKTQVHERFVLKPSTSKLRFVLYSQKATQRGLREMLRRHSVHGRTKTFKVSLNILSERCLQWVSRTERHIFHTRPCV